MTDDVFYCFITNHPKLRGLQQRESCVWLLILHFVQDSGSQLTLLHVTAAGGAEGGSGIIWKLIHLHVAAVTGCLLRPQLGPWAKT